MMASLKRKLAGILARALSIGARQAVTDVSRRIDTFARLTAEATEFTREISAAARREQIELRHRLDAIERLLETAKTPSPPPPPSRYAFLGGTTGLATVDHGHRLFVDTRDRQLTPHLVTNGAWEAWNAQLFRQVLRDGDLVVDGGSNVGYFVTLAADLVGRSGHVYAFEANQDVAGLLTASVEINGFASRVTVSHVAVYDAKGVARFVTYSNRQGDGTLLEHGPEASPACGTVTDVSTDKLDSILPRGTSIRLMHLDIEGAEHAALRGARRLIGESHRLVLLVEWGRYGTDVTELRWLIEQGFALWVMQHTGTPKPVELADLTATGLCDLLLYRGALTDLGYDVH